VIFKELGEKGSSDAFFTPKVTITTLSLRNIYENL